MALKRNEQQERYKRDFLNPQAPHNQKFNIIGKSKASKKKRG